MSNKVIFGLVAIALIISLGGFYFSLTAPRELKESIKSLEEANKKLDREIDLLSQQVPPYIYTGQAVGYVIEFENGIKFYFSGDTGLTADFELIGNYYRPDVAFLPIGNIYALDSKAAAFAASLIKPSQYIVPTHYAGFPELTKEPELFFEELEKYGLTARPLEFEVGAERKIAGIKAEWLGHNHWLFESPNGARILVDPGIKYNPQFPKKYQELLALEKIDFVLITDGHFDSMNLSDIRKWGQLFDPIFIAPYELGIWLKANFPAYKIIAIDQGSRISRQELLNLGITEDKVKDLTGIVINVVSASHSSSATPEGSPAQD